MCIHVVVTGVIAVRCFADAQPAGPAHTHPSDHTAEEFNHSLAPGSAPDTDLPASSSIAQDSMNGGMDAVDPPPSGLAAGAPTSDLSDDIRSSGILQAHSTVGDAAVASPLLDPDDFDVEEEEPASASGSSGWLAGFAAGAKRMLGISQQRRYGLLKNVFLSFSS